MEIHIGHLIKKEVIRQDIPLNALAGLINKSRTNIYDIFKRKTLDTDLLEKICVALNINIFELLAREIQDKLGPNVQIPKKVLEPDNLMSFLKYGDDREAISEEEIRSGLLNIKKLAVTLKINGDNFYDIGIELPDNVLSKLLKAYDTAVAGSLKGLEGDALGERFFQWLERYHLALAVAVKDAVERKLLDYIGEGDEWLRDVVNYEEPTSIDTWFALDDNDISYYLDDLPKRIVIEKRELK